MSTVKNNPKDLRTERAEWRELKTQKSEFQEMVVALNRFYSLHLHYVNTDTFQFRKEICTTTPDNLEIFLQKFGEYEYLIYVTIKSGENTKKDSWIHIDGIKQERDELLKTGNNTHNVFELICLSDLYDVSEKAEVQPL